MISRKVGFGMAPKFRKIDPRFWHDEKVQTLDPKQKLLALYLLTGPDVNRIGLYRFSPAKCVEELKIDRLDTVLDTVCHTLSWGYSKAQKLVYFPSWWKYNKPENEKAFSGYLKDVHDLPYDPLILLFLDNFRHLKDEFRESLRLYGMAYRLDTVSPLEKEKEMEQEKEKESGFLSSPNPTPRNASGYSPEFEAFWSIYPTQGKKAKGGAWKAWKKLDPSRELQQTIADAIEGQIEAREAKRLADPRAFIENWKHAATWINGECWADELDAGERKPKTQAETSDDILRREDAERKREMEEFLKNGHAD